MKSLLRTRVDASGEKVLLLLLVMDVETCSCRRKVRVSEGKIKKLNFSNQNEKIKALLFYSQLGNMLLDKGLKSLELPTDGIVP